MTKEDFIQRACIAMAGNPKFVNDYNSELKFSKILENAERMAERVGFITMLDSDGIETHLSNIADDLNSIMLIFENKPTDK